MDLRPRLPELWASDRTTRSEAMRSIVLAERSAYDDEVVSTLVLALDHNDYEIQEWATVALRRLRKDPRVIRALWRCFETETRHSARSCALIALGRLGECLSPTRLLELYLERKDHPKDLILESAIRWAGKNAPTQEMLLALRTIQRAEAERVRREPRLQVTIASALLRAARRGLVERTVEKSWLKEHHFQDLLDKLRETRIERLIAEERARRAQPSLQLGNDGELDDTPLVPGLPLEDVALEQYVQDRAAMLNERLGERRTYVRDRHLALEAKRKAAYRCQACGDMLADQSNASRFVQAHHVTAISELGPDVDTNLVVLCPSCHAKVHAGALRVELTSDAPRFVDAATQESSASVGTEASEAIVQQIGELFVRLEPEGQERVVERLIAVLARNEPDDLS